MFCHARRSGSQGCFVQKDESHAALVAAPILRSIPVSSVSACWGRVSRRYGPHDGTVRARCGVDASILRRNAMLFPARIIFERAILGSHAEILVLRWHEPGYGRGAAPAPRLRDLSLKNPVCCRVYFLLSFLQECISGFKALPQRRRIRGKAHFVSAAGSRSYHKTAEPKRSSAAAIGRRHRRPAAFIS